MNEYYFPVRIKVEIHKTAVGIICQTIGEFIFAEAGVEQIIGEGHINGAVIGNGIFCLILVKACVGPSVVFEILFA